MKFETRFNIGDKGWVFLDGKIHQLTIGKICIEHTDSQGIDGAFGDNFKRQSCHKEQYMCEETGIGSGHVYTLGKSIFDNREDCEEANRAILDEQEKARAEAKAYQAKRDKEEYERARYVVAAYEAKGAA